MKTIACHATNCSPSSRPSAAEERGGSRKFPPTTTSSSPCRRAAARAGTGRRPPPLQIDARAERRHRRSVWAGPPGCCCCCVRSTSYEIVLSLPVRARCWCVRGRMNRQNNNTPLARHTSGAASLLRVRASRRRRGGRTENDAAAEAALRYHFRTVVPPLSLLPQKRSEPQQGLALPRSSAGGGLRSRGRRLGHGHGHALQREEAEAARGDDGSCEEVGGEAERARDHGDEEGVAVGELVADACAGRGGRGVRRRGAPGQGEQQSRRVGGGAPSE